MRLLRSGIFFKGFIASFIFCLFFLGSVSSETIDRIMAVVQDDVITLTDVRIAEAFFLYDKAQIDPAKDLRPQVLDNLINRKLVTLMTREDVLVGEAEIDTEFQRLIEELGVQNVQAKLGDFGLNHEELREFLQEGLFYRKILSRRFNKTIIVSLREIEQYYSQSYIPSLEEKGENIKPMMEILDQLESSVKKEKIDSQIATWLNNLRREAYIEIKEGA